MRNAGPDGDLHEDDVVYVYEDEDEDVPGTGAPLGATHASASS